MCGKNAEQGSSPTDKGSGLDSTKSSRRCDAAMRDEERISVDVSDEHGCLGAHSPSTGGLVLDAYRFKVLQEIESKTTLDDNAKCACLLVEELNIAQIRALNRDRHREKFP